MSDLQRFPNMEAQEARRILQERRDGVIRNDQLNRNDTYVSEEEYEIISEE